MGRLITRCRRRPLARICAARLASNRCGSWDGSRINGNWLTLFAQAEFGGTRMPGMTEQDLCTRGHFHRTDTRAPEFPVHSSCPGAFVGSPPDQLRTSWPRRQRRSLFVPCGLSASYDSSTFHNPSHSWEGELPESAGAEKPPDSSLPQRSAGARLPEKTCLISAGVAPCGLLSS
jgi:hypothetical protein